MPTRNPSGSSGGSASAMARGRVALAGDAAHPMRPYFAQGACMAIEDGARLAHELGGGRGSAPEAALGSYARARWARCAKVQERSRSNGDVFHAEGPIRWSRDLALRVAGARLLDQPWLYAHREPGT